MIEENPYKPPVHDRPKSFLEWVMKFCRDDDLLKVLVVGDETVLVNSRNAARYVVYRSTFKNVQKVPE